MRVLLIGSGAREHAIGWALTKSRRVTELMSLPGNPGLAALGPTVDGVGPADAGAVAAIARVHDVDLVVIGPEGPLAAGTSDAVRHLGLPVFGPSRAAARLESSKSFAKDIMRKAGVPTPDWGSFTEAGAAHEHIDHHTGPYVVKADGLAAGKGVLVTDDRDAARRWVDQCFEGAFGDAGSTILIEQHVEGPELSVFAVSDGEHAVALEPARDYKRLGDGDTGPNTGGMGSYSPVDLPAGLVETVMDRIIRPTIATMSAAGMPYVGFLYAGLVLTDSGPTVIEFNARLGDPETQVLIPRLETDFLDIVSAALDGTVDDLAISWSENAAVDVVLAAPGYPEDPRTGDLIRGDLSEEADSIVFHAGTARDDGGRLRTSGGRVLSVVGLGSDVAAARQAAMARVQTITWPGRQHRSDIAAPSAADSAMVTRST